MREQLRFTLRAAFTILFVWFVAEGDLVEDIWMNGWSDHSRGELLRQALPNLFLAGVILGALVLLANADRLLQIAFHLLSAIVGRDYSNANAKECLRRKEMLARAEYSSNRLDTHGSSVRR